MQRSQENVLFDSTKVYSNEFGVYCDDCGAVIDYEESSCCRT